MLHATAATTRARNAIQLRRLRISQQGVQVIFKRASVRASVLEPQITTPTLALLPPLAIVRVFPGQSQHTTTVAAAVEPFAVVARALTPWVLEAATTVHGVVQELA